MNTGLPIFRVTDPNDPHGRITVFAPDGQAARSIAWQIIPGKLRPPRDTLEIERIWTD